MKLRRYILALIILLTPCITGEVLASGAKTVVVTNNTSYTINELYASPSDAGSWDSSPNLLTGHTVAPGQATTISIADGLDECTYDLMAILYGLAQYTYDYEIDTCAGGSWEISVSP